MAVIVVILSASSSNATAFDARVRDEAGGKKIGISTIFPEEIRAGSGLTAGVKSSQTAASPQSQNNPFTHVSPELQAQRDQKRGKILLYELRREKERLNLVLDQIEEIKREKPTAVRGKLLEHLDGLRRIHATNVQAINMELSRL